MRIQKRMVYAVIFLVTMSAAIAQADSCLGTCGTGTANAM